MKKLIDKYISWLLIALMALITLDVVWGVFTRYALGHQASWTEELARYMLVWIGILGAAYASGQKKHLAIDLLSAKLKPESKIKLEMVITFMIAFFAVTVMIIGGLRLMYITHTLGQTSAAMRIPMALVYASIPLAGFLVLFYKIEVFRELWQYKKGVNE